MATVERDIHEIQLTEDELWEEGPPHEVFKRMRGECPIHRTERFFSDIPDEPGFWSVTTAEDVHKVSRDWQTYSSELGGITASGGFPLELSRAMFIGMDPPKHDRVKALFQRGFTPKRIADHEERIRAIVSECSTAWTGRERCDLVSDVAQPVVSRVIGSFMGITAEEDAIWARADELDARRAATRT